MAAVWILINLSRVVGVAGVATVAANGIAYLRFRKRRLAPFAPPIDESQEVVARFPIDLPADEGGFFFAVATAPAHVEDNLHDAWLEFAQQTKPHEKSRDDDTENADDDDAKEIADKEAPGREDKPVDNFSEWEVVGSGLEKERSPKQDKDKSSSQLRRAGRSTIEEPTLQFNVPKKARKLAKVAMEAMLRGIEKLAEENETEDKLNVAAWHNAVHPEERVRFWSDPDTELRLAQETNVTVFRLGVDWTRIMPVEPVDGVAESINWSAVRRYKWIIQRVHDHGMRVMLTLFHHSLPPWAAEYGGWKNEKTLGYFLDFTRLVAEECAPLVDYWVTLNEPHVFVMLTYCAGAWPGGKPDLLETATAVMPKGVFNRAMKLMAAAHLKAYDIIHAISQTHSKKARVGIAHHVSFTRPYGLFDVSAAMLSNWKTQFPFVDDICEKLDYLGVNYYGQEFISAPGLKLVENEEYSESGRGVYPDGLYRVLLAFHERYKHLGLPFIITENGVSDSTDYIRRPYITEHLLAIRAAMNKGVRVHGYCFWTTSDNWEWADGYGPKFGLAAVDRKNNLARHPRPSYYLFSEIARTGKVTKQQRSEAWNELADAAAKGVQRPFYRAVDASGRMYAGGLDVPTQRKFVQRDWRFGHYEMDGLQDPLSIALSSLWRLRKSRRPPLRDAVEEEPELLQELTPQESAAPLPVRQVVA